MRPEVASSTQFSGDSTQEAVDSTQSPEPSAEEGHEMAEDEEVVLDLLKANSPSDLNALKEQTGLSNKKWDKAIKGLTKNKLARVERTDEGLFVSVV